MTANQILFRNSSPANKAAPAFAHSVSRRSHKVLNLVGPLVQAEVNRMLLRRYGFNRKTRIVTDRDLTDLGDLDCLGSVCHSFSMQKRPWECSPKAVLLFYQLGTMFRATWTPLAEAWEREWVMPLPSPMIYRPG